jgi:hypothetical protein
MIRRLHVPLVKPEDGYVPSPDGERFLTLLSEESASTNPLNVTVNWSTTLLRSKPLL